jgi:integrase
MGTSEAFAERHIARTGVTWRAPIGIPEGVGPEYFEPANVTNISKRIESEQYRLLVLVLGRVGLRFGEAAGLERRHVDLLRGRIKVEQSATEVAGELVIGPTKTYQQRTVPIPPSLLPALRDHLEHKVGAAHTAPVFMGGRGGRLRHGNFYKRVWRPALAEAKLPAVGLHVLRHSAAAALIASGANAKAVQTILGHRSAAFTLTVYGHLFDNDLDALAKRLDAFVTRNERGMKRKSQKQGRALRAV